MAAVAVVVTTGCGVDLRTALEECTTDAEIVGTEGPDVLRGSPTTTSSPGSAATTRSSAAAATISSVPGTATTSCRVAAATTCCPGMPGMTAWMAARTSIWSRSCLPPRRSPPILLPELEAAGDPTPSSPSRASSARIRDTIAGDDRQNLLQGGVNEPRPTADTISGRGGADVLAGSAGDDALDGGQAPTGSTTRSQAGRRRRSPGAGKATGEGADRLVGIEVVMGSPRNDRITGDAGANQLAGGNGADVLRGAGGNDLLHGMNGKDSIAGGAGNDQLDGGSGRDRLDGGPGRGSLWPRRAEAELSVTTPPSRWEVEECESCKARRPTSVGCRNRSRSTRGLGARRPGGRFRCHAAEDLPAGDALRSG